jgi:hypothetical protein
LSLPFQDAPGGFVQALDSSLKLTEPSSGPKKFFRFVRALSP